MIESGDIFDMYSRTKRTKPKKKEKEKKPVREQAKHTEITIGDTIVVKDLAQELKESGYLKQEEGSGNLTAVIISGQPNVAGGTDTIQIRKI